MFTTRRGRHDYKPVEIDRIWAVKGASYFKLCLFNVMHGEPALRLAQAHPDALKPVIHYDDSPVSDEPKTICGGFDAMSPDIMAGFASCLPNHISQLGGYSADAVCVITQIVLFLPLVAPYPHTRVRRSEGLRNSGCIFAWHPQ